MVGESLALPGEKTHNHPQVVTRPVIIKSFPSIGDDKMQKNYHILVNSITTFKLHFM